MTDPAPGDAALTYARYLALDEVLGAQRPRSDEHDELLFIVVHQVYELWFKQLLHELGHAQALLEDGHTAPVVHTLRRVADDPQGRRRPDRRAGDDDAASVHRLPRSPRRVERLPVGAVPRARGRARSPRSGRARRPPGRQPRRAPASPRRWPDRRCTTRSSSTSRPTASPCRPTLIRRDVTAPPARHPELDDVLLAVYVDDGGPAQVCERLVDLDEGLQEWRYRHVKMVERTIGDKAGTGGSSGAAYLRATLFTPAVPRPVGRAQPAVTGRLAHGSPPADHHQTAPPATTRAARTTTIDPGGLHASSAATRTAVATVAGGDHGGRAPPAQRECRCRRPRSLASPRRGRRRRGRRAAPAR